uniref:CSON007751 protein n=1 Tax=Culicoides sonorensis TaxID=179676 RepID=A0A336MV66_CULSO
MAKSKTELEIERHVLPLEVKLSDGTYGRVFSRAPRNNNNIFVYTCHICSVTNLPGELILQRHIQGRKHQLKMDANEHDATQFRSSIAKTPQIAMNIAPGEPVPPGFENEVKLFSHLQEILDKLKSDKSLVGIEYVMELTPEGRGDPSYHCILCDKRGDKNTIIPHISSHNHRLKYLEKHFPSVIKEIGPVRFNKEALKRRIPQEIIEQVCKSIEDYHGRLKPNVHPAKDYEDNKMKYLQEAIFDKHFDERTGPNFVDAVDKKVIDLFYKTHKEENGNTNKDKGNDIVIVKDSREDTVIELSDASSISSGSIGGRSRSRSPNTKRRRLNSNRKRPVSKSPIDSRTFKRRSKSPVRRNNSNFPKVKLDHLEVVNKESAQFDKQLKEKGRFKKCQDEISKMVEHLKKEYKKHEENPEKHPDYNEEWKEFWNRRFRELEKEKKDPHTHDFKPEWIVFWKNRMKQILDDNISKKTREIQLKYLNMRSVSPAKVDPRTRTVNRSRSRDRQRNRKSRSNSLSSVSSSDHSIGRSRRARSRSSHNYGAPEHYKDPYQDNYYSKHRPIFPGYEMDPYANYYGYGQPTAPYYGKPHVPPTQKKKEPTPEKQQEEEDEEDDQPVNLVSVLRTVAALEDHLGQSLGPRIIDLLSKALALEKVKANSADEVLLSDDVCVLLETVKEKLKGTLNAKLVKGTQEKAVKKAIKNIAELIHIFSKKNGDNNKDGKENDKKPQIKRDPIEENLATRIKSALIVQGEIDANENVIDLLIGVFCDMAKQYPKDNKTQFTVKKYLIQNKYIEAEKSMSGENALESLTDADLRTLLVNFKELSSGEQKHLTLYLKKLEVTDPARVRKLRSYLELDEDDADDDDFEIESRSESRAEERFTEKPTVEPKDPRLADFPVSKAKTDIFLSDDEDDYNYDDLVKSTKSKAMELESEENTNMSSNKEDTQQSRDSIMSKLTMADTQNLIANLMGSLQESINTIQKAKPPTPQQQQQQQPQKSPVPAKPAVSQPKSSGYNHFVAQNTIQAVRPSTFSGNQQTKPQQMAQQQNQQQNASSFQMQGNQGNQYSMQQQFQQPFSMYGNQMNAGQQYGQYQGQVNQQNSAYGRQNNSNVSPWQIPPQQQQQQQNNNAGSQPFYQWYQN